MASDKPSRARRRKWRPIKLSVVVPRRSQRLFLSAISDAGGRIDTKVFGILYKVLADGLPLADAESLREWHEDFSKDLVRRHLNAQDAEAVSRLASLIGFHAKLVMIDLLKDDRVLQLLKRRLQKKDLDSGRSLGPQTRKKLSPHEAWRQQIKHEFVRKQRVKPNDLVLILREYNKLNAIKLRSGHKHDDRTLYEFARKELNRLRDAS